MVVLDGFDADRGDGRPVHAAIVLPRYGIVVRDEDDAIAVMNADGERARSVPLQLFAPRTRKAPDDSQILRGVEVIEPLSDLLPALLAEPLPKELLVVAEIAQIGSLE